MTVLFGPPCRTCGKAVTQFVDKVVGGDDLRGHQCETCYADEQAAYGKLLDYLAQRPTEMAQCGQCHKSLDRIELETGSRKLYMHVEPGNVTLLCRKCSDAVTARMSTATVQGRYKHLSKEEMFYLMLKEHWHKLRRWAKGA